MAKKQKKEKPKSVAKPMTNPPTCPQGQVWDSVLGKCVVNDG